MSEETDIQDLLDNLTQKGIEALNNKQDQVAKVIFAQSYLTCPDYSPAASMYATILARGGNYEYATFIMEKSLAADPSNPELLNNYALIVRDIDRERAKQILIDAALRTNRNVLWSNLSQFAKDEGDYQKAIEYVDRAIAANSEGYLWFNKGEILSNLNQVEESIACYRKAIEHESKPEYHFNLACMLLLQGNWREGWDAFELRWNVFPVFAAKRNFLNRKWPEWHGQDLKGATLLLYCEQGVGDKIQYVRYVDALKQLGATVIVETPPELVGLFSRVKGIDRILKKGEVLDHCDYHISMMSLTKVLGILPNNAGYFPYLTPPDKIDFFEGKYRDKMKIGIVWAGNPVHRNDHQRSCPLKHFKPIADLPNVKLFSLMHDLRPRMWPNIGQVDLSEGADFPIVDLQEYLKDFDSTARIINSLDLVISVDTSTAHLAGALGKDTCLLLPFNPDWRWMLHRNDTVWYQHTKLYRQNERGNWAEVLQRLANDLKEPYKKWSPFEDVFKIDWENNKKLFAGEVYNSRNLLEA